MAYKKNIFKDKTVVTLSTISIVAAAALIGGIAMDSGAKSDKEKTEKLVDLNESDTTLDFAKNNDSLDLAEEETSVPETVINEDLSEPIAIEDSAESTEQLAEEVTTSQDEAEVSVNAPADKLNFTADSLLTWPVDGNIVIDYNMENTVYFPTLDLYKCSDAICIQSDIGTPVYASNECIVKEIGTSEEIGTYVRVDLGNEYILTYGQLKDIVVGAEDVLASGDLIGYISSPSDYYSVEGPNLYLKLTENGSPVNPLDHLNYE